MSDRQKTASSTRRTGFVSAVLLVVLLATSGWPGECHPLVDNTYVTSCESSQAEVRRVIAGNRPMVLPLVITTRAERPRVLPRQRRVDSWGLPPPRAPTI